MSPAPRYAIYFVPAADSPLYQFGASALEYDCHTGADAAPLPGRPFGADAWRTLTEAPRVYGFHATLKAPFRLPEDRAEGELIDAFSEFTRKHLPLAPVGTAINVISGFAALVPDGPAENLRSLADDCVAAFDAFRAPLTPKDRERRLQSGLTERQRENLERWGYPYVFEDFRFHMTLTGQLEPAQKDKVTAFLRDTARQRHVPRDLVVDSIALVRQETPASRFRVILRSLLGR